MTWEDKLIRKLIELRGDRPVNELAEETGIPAATLYAILRGSRGIGKETLEQLRRTKPELVAGVFLPSDYPVGQDNSRVGES